MTFPEVTLYIPVYNGSHFLREALPAVAALNYPDHLLRTVVIDDGSEDWAQTKSLCEQYQVEFLRKEKNEGLSAARNTALAFCESPFLASLDADCVPDPLWLQKLVEKLTQKDDPKMAGIAGRLDERYHHSLADAWRASHMCQHWGDECVNDPEYLSGNNNLFRTAALREVEGYPTGDIYRTNHEDYYMSQTLKKYGYFLYYIPDARVDHLRKDSIESVLRAFWRYYFLAHPCPDTLFNLVNKFRRNIMFYMIPFIFRDLVKVNLKAALVDLLFPFYQSAQDIKYYSRRKK